MKKTEIDKKVQQIKESQPKYKPNTAIQNNYYHYEINISPKELSTLAQKDPKSAQMFLELQKSQLEHAKEVDRRILTLEEKEQDMRHKELPYARRLYARGQIFAFVTILLGFLSAVGFGYLKMEKAAIVSIAIAGGTVVAQFLGNSKPKTEEE